MKNSNRLHFNQQAPDLELLNIAGKTVTLSSLWKKRPLILAFTRHFGCTQCKEMLDELMEGK
jgi:peroxiredoxin